MKICANFKCKFQILHIVCHRITLCAVCALHILESSGKVLLYRQIYAPDKRNSGTLDSLNLRFNCRKIDGLARKSSRHYFPALWFACFIFTLLIPIIVKCYK